MHHAPVINRDIALARMGGDETLLAQLAEYFLADAPVLLSELDVAVKANDVTAIIHAVHSLKGLASNFEAVPAVHAAQEIEKLKGQESLSGCQPLFESLHLEVARLMEALQPMVQDIQSRS